MTKILLENQPAVRGEDTVKEENKESLQALMDEMQPYLELAKQPLVSPQQQTVKNILDKASS